MTSLVRTNGRAIETELVGRDLKFVLLAATGIETTYNVANSNFEKAVRVLEKFCTVTIIGIPSAGNVRFVVEGLPAGNINNYLGVSAAIATVLATDCDAANGLASTWTINDSFSGTTFA